jgi:hypothetical protein
VEITLIVWGIIYLIKFLAARKQKKLNLMVHTVDGNKKSRNIFETIRKGIEKSLAIHIFY